jgi:hypothetical protein
MAIQVEFGIAMNKKLALIFLVCFSLFFLGCAFHHHQDGDTHDNCSICFCVLHHSNLAFQDFPQFSPPLADGFLGISENAVSLSSPCRSPYSNRAPPA